MSLKSKVAPFANKYCSLKIDASIAPRLKGARWRLFMFDWSRVGADLKETIAEQAGQDDYEIFAAVNPPEETGTLEEIVEDGVEAYLLWSPKTATIYTSMGEMETLTKNVDAFFAKLVVLEEGEEVE
jgi:hypothetical protein